MVSELDKRNSSRKVVVLEDVSKILGDKRILDSVSFTVSEGEIFFDWTKCGRKNYNYQDYSWVTHAYFWKSRDFWHESIEF